MADGQGKGRKFGRCRDSKSHAAYLAEDRAAKHHRENLAKATKLASTPKVIKVARGTARAARRHVA